MPIAYELTEGVATVTIDRPQKLNAIDPPMRAQLRDTWRRIGDDPAVRACVVTGAGDRAFCVGSDLVATAGPQPAAATDVIGGQGAGHLLDGIDHDVPMIAAVNGLAVGGGFEIALACDIRIAAENASFGLSEVRVGSIPGAGGTQKLPRVIGHSDAMYMLLTGERIDAARALRVGLISEVLPVTELAARAQEIAALIAANAPLSVRAIKRLARAGMDAPLSVGMALERLAFGLIRDTDDRREGRAAFAAKRPAQFTGR
jgi:E-phenylitaconyl-CoA hydratase